MNFHKFLKTCFYAFIALAVHRADAKPWDAIEKIKIQTPNQKLKTKLERYLNQYKSSPYSKSAGSMIKQDITQYLLSRKYRNAILKGPFLQSRKHKHTLSFKIEHPYQYQFIIKNNSRIKHSRLLQAIDVKTLIHQTSFVKTAARRMKSYYLSKGYNNVQMDCKTTEDTTNYIYSAVCTVHEGYEFRIKKISITGSFSKSRNYYKQLFFSYSSPALKSKIYVPQDFDLALKKLTAHLRRNGFFNSKIYHKNIRIKKNKVFIEIFLNEGPPLIIKNISIKGNSVLSDGDVKEIIGIKENAVLNLENWSEGIQNLVRAYKDKGFFSAGISNVNRMLDIQKSFQTAHINIQINEGSRAFVHNIQVKGNKKVKTEFIIHASGLKKGAYIQNKDIQKAVDFIDDLEIFSNVHITPITSKSNKTIILIEVVERNFRFFRILFGGNTRNTLSVHLPAEYIEKRFLNSDNSELILNGRLGTNLQLLNYSFDRLLTPKQKKEDLISKVLNRKFFEYDFSIKYKKSYFWNTRWSTQISYLKSDDIFSFPERKYNGIQWIQSDIFTFSLERKFDLNTILNIKLLELEEIESRTVKNGLSPFKKKNEILSLTGLSFLIDRRNDIFYPTSGQMLSSRLEYSPPFLGANSPIHFLKTESRYSFYIPIFSTGIIWAQSLNGGYVHRFGSAGIPVTHLFILGGPGSLRGFDGDINGERVPNRHELEIENANDIIRESSFYFLTQSELRLPIYKDVLKGVIFYDGGYMHLTKTVQKKPYRHTIGLGVHYGLLVLTVGFKLNPFQHKKPDGALETEAPFNINFQVGVF